MESRSSHGFSLGSPDTKPPLEFGRALADGVETRNAYPSTGSVYDMRTIQTRTPYFPFGTDWRNVEQPTCPGAPNGTFVVTANATQQDVMWTVGWGQ